MWVKIDDKLHAHRKTRRLTTSDGDKRRDAAPMGLWLLAASWAGQNNPAMGWVPVHELDRWDDDWEHLAQRLVKAGFWWPEQNEGEDGYGFVDWADYNPAHGSSESGTFGNHVRWHVNRKVVEPGCEHCPQEPPADDDIAPQSPPDIAPDSGGDIAPDSRNIALPEPEPDPNPTKNSCASTDVEREFEEWYSDYPRKRGRGQAIKAYRTARKKVSHQDLMDAVAKQMPVLTKDGVGFAPYPATWLNGERWADDIDETPQQTDSGLPSVAEVERQVAEREARERGESA